ncbi:putative leader peptide [Nocardioides marmoriginsengisoli]
MQVSLLCWYTKRAARGDRPMSTTFHTVRRHVDLLRTASSLCR